MSRISDLAEKYAALSKEVEALEAVVAGKASLGVTVQYDDRKLPGIYAAATSVQKMLSPLVHDLARSALKARTEQMMLTRAELRQAEEELGPRLTVVP